jgi:hypothetical protein
VKHVKADIVEVEELEGADAKTLEINQLLSTATGKPEAPKWKVHESHWQQHLRLIKWKLLASRHEKLQLRGATKVVMPSNFDARAVLVSTSGRWSPIQTSKGQSL